MPMYKLLFRTNGVLGNTNVQLQVNGTSATTLDVQARTTGTPPGPWSTVLNATSRARVARVRRTTRRTATHSLPSEVLTVCNITGTGTFDQNGDGSNGPGYYTDQGPEEAEGDWCATAG